MRTLSFPGGRLITIACLDEVDNVGPYVSRTHRGRNDRPSPRPGGHRRRRSAARVCAGPSDGSVPVNAAGGWLHDIAGETYVVAPACFEAFAAGRISRFVDQFGNSAAITSPVVTASTRILSRRGRA